MFETPLVNVHIEKTAGRTVRTIFIDNFGERNVLTYNPATDSLLRASDRLIATERQERTERVVSNKVLIPLARIGLRAARAIESTKSFRPECLPEDFSVITGHFPASRFEVFLPPEQAEYVTVLRHPLDRMRSHYEHWKRTRGTASFRVDIPYDETMDFEHFALAQELLNYQADAISIDPTRFRSIGTVEYLDNYLEELGLKHSTDSTPHLNKADYREIDFTMSFLAQFEEAHSLDYELFHKATRTWE
jgi:hypothetical protein